MNDSLSSLRSLSIVMSICMLITMGCAAPEQSNNATAAQSGDTAAPASSFESAYRDENSKYGVFLSYDGPLEDLRDYNIIVIDAQYYDKEEILEFKDSDHFVLSYINVGSLEDFRDYYDEYKDLALGRYEHWDEEVWIDVSNKRWQDFVLNDLAPDLLDRGIDGLFVDNCDVYYCYHTGEILEGLSDIMRGLKKMSPQVIINGGDTFLDDYTERLGDQDDVMTGINQESVITSIDWENDTFTTASDDDREYFEGYIDKYAAKGALIFLLEYTTDPDAEREIRRFCEKRGYKYYISDSLELNF